MDKAIEVQIRDKALEIAGRKLFLLKGCVGGGGFCTVATTQYSKEEETRICSRCWKNMLIEMAADMILEEEQYGGR